MLKRMIVTVFITMSFFASLFALPEATLTTELQEKMLSTSSDEMIPIIIALSERTPSAQLLAESRALPVQQRRQYVVDELKNFSSYTQREIKQTLLSNRGNVSDVRSLWIANVILCDATAEAIESLAGRADIRRIDWDNEQNLLDPREWQNSRIVDGQREITWNVTNVNAHQVWDLGYTGEGITIAVIDTGVNYNHTDLSDHVWEDEDYPNHGYDFANNDTNPMDDNGHGTHCAGTVAGDGTSGSQTGMAPDATIMCLKVLTGSGNGQESDVWEAVEFAVEHGANAFSMSLGWTDSSNPDYESWRDTMVNTLAAGVTGAVAAGNEGDYTGWYPVPHNVRVPGCCPPPWLHPDQTLEGDLSCVVCVGATNSGNTIANFSSRGPCTWEDVNTYGDYPYTPNDVVEIGLIRPDIVAPGANIKSLDYSSNTGYADGWDGTSMATPCVAGVIALMLDKNEYLMPEEIDQILENNRYVITDEKDNTYGSGRVDALLAVEATTPPDMPPYAPIHPIPENECVYTHSGTDIQWHDGGGNPAEYYMVYLGTEYPPTNILNGEQTTDTSYNLDGLLEFGTQYYWRIDAVNVHGYTEGNTWTFTTLAESSESFESGDLSMFEWYYNSQVPWYVDDSQALEGAYSARSAEIPGYFYTELCLDVYIPYESEVTFAKKVSCEDDENDNLDRLVFLIDDEEMGRWDGEIDWSFSSFPISYGAHTIAWRYLKVNNSTEGEDCAWIDYIILPPSLYPPTELTAHSENGNNVQLQWIAPSDSDEVLGYKVYRDEELISEIEDSETLEYLDEGLANGTYLYTVSATYEEGNSPVSNEAEATIWLPMPPLNLSADIEDNCNIILTWDMPSDRALRMNDSSSKTLARNDLTGFRVYCEDEMIAELSGSETLTYTDEDMAAGVYHYCVTAMYRGTESDPSNVVEAEIVSNDDSSTPEFTTRLIGACPNPFNPTTVISFELATEQHVNLTVYNTLGQKVRTLASSRMQAGPHQISWDGRDDSGKQVGTGVYVYALHGKTYVSVKKMVMLK